MYEDYSDRLEHFGVLGMRWGVRRYQNRDGTLTPAGKKLADKRDQAQRNVDNLSSVEGRRKLMKAHGAGSETLDKLQKSNQEFVNKTNEQLRTKTLRDQRAYAKQDNRQALKDSLTALDKEARALQKMNNVNDKTTDEQKEQIRQNFNDAKIKQKEVFDSLKDRADHWRELATDRDAIGLKEVKKAEKVAKQTMDLLGFDKVKASEISFYKARFDPDDIYANFIHNSGRIWANNNFIGATITYIPKDVRLERGG